MSKELLKQLKVKDKVWAELEVSEEDVDVVTLIDYDADTFEITKNNNFSLSDPNELTVRELCEWIKGKGYGDACNPIELYNDFSGGSRDGVIDFNSLDQLTELVRNPNAQRKEEIKKQIEELQNELNKL